MDRRIANERQRLIAEAAARVDAQRRRWKFALPFMGALACTALATIVPGHEKLWGDTTPAQSFLFLGAGIGSIFACALIYRAFGNQSRAYQAAEACEVLALTGQPVAFAYSGGDAVLVFWFMHLLGPLFWAQVKPALWRRYNAVSLVACLVSAALCWRDGREGSAVIALFMGMFTAAIVARVGRWRLGTFTLEAERNVAQAELSALRVEQERRALVRKVETELGDDLRRLADDLERYDPTRAEAEHARQIATDIERLWRDDAAGTTAALADRIEQKCRPLCLKIAYEQTARIATTRSLSDATTTALLRIAQELVRNAATHSGGERVMLELVVDEAATTLSVRDDGKGVQPETLGASRGGLDNAARRLQELGGTLALTPQRRGTALVARVPR
jgi:signal transduction histidine kinase